MAKALTLQNLDTLQRGFKRGVVVGFFALVILGPHAALAIKPPPEFTDEIHRVGTGEFRVVSVDLNIVDLHLVWKKPDGNAYALLSDVRSSIEARGAKFLFATNAGIYDKALRPLGLHIENGKTIRNLNRSRVPGGNFSMLPNGVLLIRDHSAQVIESGEYKESASTLYATQSGPLLVHNGKLHPSFTKGSLNKKLRSGVGVDKNNRVIFALSRGPVNFYDFAELFKHELDCENALYLDGTISEFLVGDQTEISQMVPFVGVITATLRAGNTKSN